MLFENLNTSHDTNKYDCFSCTQHFKVLRDMYGHFTNELRVPELGVVASRESLITQGDNVEEEEEDVEDELEYEGSAIFDEDAFFDETTNKV